MLAPIVAAVVASATVSLSSSPRGSLEEWAMRLRSSVLLRDAAQLGGTAIGAVRTSTNGYRILIEVEGQSGPEAIAGCSAVLRAAEQEARAPEEEALRTTLAQRATQRRQLELVERRLADAPTTARRPTNARVALTEAQEALRRLDVADLETGAGLPWRLRALIEQAGRLRAERTAQRGTLRDQHPEIVELTTRIGALDRRIAAQLEVERRSARSLVDLLGKMPPRVGPALVLRARRAAQLDGVLADGCALASDGPTELLERADACDSARDELEAVSMHYAERHPKVVAAAAQLDEARRQLTAQRELVAAMLKAQIASSASPISAESEQARGVRRAELLREELIRLDDRIIQSQATLAQWPPLFHVLDACATQPAPRRP